jgi:predicted ribosome quality control (RQC) complex YloA/Tae2 family protein
MKKEVITVTDGEITRDYIILIGQNAKENEDIIRASDPEDIWFHFENVSGPHVIIQSGGDIIPKRYLFEVAAKLFENKQKVPRNQGVIYTEVKNVKLTKTLGTVIPRNTKTLKL